MSLGAPKEAFAQGAANVALATSAETVVCTLSGVDTTPESDPVQLQGEVDVTTGTGTTALVLRVRRGTTTADALVGAASTSTASAGVSESPTIQVEDVPGQVAGQSYVLTVQQTGATANGTSVASSLRAVY